MRPEHKVVLKQDRRGAAESLEGILLRPLRDERGDDPAAPCDPKFVLAESNPIG
jgi:hypothetical protein